MDDSVYLNLTLELVPFFNIFREDMEESINSLAQDLEKCCVGNPHVEVIHTGSGFEGLSLPHLEKSTAWNTDADHMIIRTDLKVHEGVETAGRNTEEGVRMKGDLAHGPMEHSDGACSTTAETKRISFTSTVLHTRVMYTCLAKNSPSPLTLLLFGSTAYRPLHSSREVNI